jgi:hypothetical protein
MVHSHCRWVDMSLSGETEDDASPIITLSRYPPGGQHTEKWLDIPDEPTKYQHIVGKIMYLATKVTVEGANAR